MKKLIALIALMIATQIQAQPAEAGILLFVNQPSNIEAASDLTLIGLSTSVVAGIIYAVNASPAAGWISTAGAMVFVLDASEQPSHDSIEEGLSTEYPFIDSNDTLAALASAVSAKLPTQVDKATMIHLTEVEVRNALMGAPLTEEEIQKIVADLK